MRNPREEKERRRGRPRTIIKMLLSPVTKWRSRVARPFYETLIINTIYVRCRRFDKRNLFIRSLSSLSIFFHFFVLPTIPGGFNLFIYLLRPLDLEDKISTFWIMKIHLQLTKVFFFGVSKLSTANQHDFYPFRYDYFNYFDILTYNSSAHRLRYCIFSARYSVFEFTRLYKGR